MKLNGTTGMHRRDLRWDLGSHAVVLAAAWALGLAALPAAAQVPLGGEFQVNRHTTGAQVRPALAASAGGAFTVVWDSEAPSGTDSSGESIHGQRYAARPLPVPSLSPGSAATAALLLMLAAGFALRRRA